MITPAYAVTATERVLPRMALDFTTGVLDPRVTVTRALNTATRVNSSGLIETVNADLPRFDYDPATLAPKGILIEESRANLVIQSEDFNTTWSASNVAVFTNTTASPSGQMNVDTLTPSSVSGVLSQNITFTGNGDKSISIFVLAGTSGKTLYFLRDTTAATPRGIATITWTGGVPSVVGSSGGTVQGVDAYGNGWYRIRLLCAGVVAANANSLRIQPDSVTGTGTVTVWGAQAENGTFATSYIPTTTTSLTRNADVVSMTGTNFSDWYNVGAGSWFIQTNARSGDTILTAGGFTLTADATALKKYADSYSSDQSASSLVIGNGTVAKLSYYKQALLAAELQALRA
jgi:hypothetical protein